MKPKSKRNNAAEDAAIDAQIAADPDDFEADADWFANARPAAPEMAELTRKYRGKQKAPTKVLKSLRISQDVLEAFQQNSDKYGPAIDDALREVARERGWL